MFEGGRIEPERHHHPLVGIVVALPQMRAVIGARATGTALGYAVRGPALVVAAKFRRLKICQSGPVAVDPRSIAQPCLQPCQGIAIGTAPAKRIREQTGQHRGAGEIGDYAAGIDGLAAEGQ